MSQLLAMLNEMFVNNNAEDNDESKEDQPKSERLHIRD